MDEVWEPVILTNKLANSSAGCGGPYFEKCHIREFIRGGLGRAPLRIEYISLVGASNSAADSGDAFSFFRPCARYKHGGDE